MYFQLIEYLEKLEETLEKLEVEGYDVIIAGAGLAAHLPGVIASKTTLPVIGVPIGGSFQRNGRIIINSTDA